MTPLEPGLKLTKDDCPKTENKKLKMSKISYRELIGSPMYLALYTRSDILYAIYCDADWACDVDKRYFYTGMIVCIGNNVVNWRSMKQKSISSSTMEVEYIASSGVKEVMWLNMMLKELDLWSHMSHGCTIYTDNRAALDFLNNKVEKTRTKHIDICYYIVGEKFEKNLFKL